MVLIPIRSKTGFFLLNFGNRLLKKVFNSSIWGREEEIEWEEGIRGGVLEVRPGQGWHP